MWAESRAAQEGVVTEVDADCWVPSGSVSVAVNARVGRSQSQGAAGLSEAVPLRVSSTPSGEASGTPGTDSATVTDGAVAPCTVSPMQPTVAVVAVIVNGPGSLAGAGASDEQGVFERCSGEVDAPAVSVALDTSAIAIAVVTPVHRAASRPTRLREGCSSFTFLL